MNINTIVQRQQNRRMSPSQTNTRFAIGTTIAILALLTGFTLMGLIYQNLETAVHPPLLYWFI